MKLFMFYIGGNCGSSNVELHDVRFSIGETAEDCHDDLRKQWWGDADSLHLDCWGAVEQADGFDIVLTKDAAANDASDRLFFVNLGGYNPSEFSELHRNVLLVASEPKAAKAKALTLIRDWSMPHKDNLFEVDRAIDLSALLESYGYSLIVKPAVETKPFKFVCDYLPIG